MRMFVYANKSKMITTTESLATVEINTPRNTEARWECIKELAGELY